MFIVEPTLYWSLEKPLYLEQGLRIEANEFETKVEVWRKLGMRVVK